MDCYFWLSLTLALALRTVLITNAGRSLGCGAVGVLSFVTRVDISTEEVSRDCDTAFGGSSAVAGDFGDTCQISLDGT